MVGEEEEGLEGLEGPALEEEEVRRGEEVRTPPG